MRRMNLVFVFLAVGWMLLASGKFLGVGYAQDAGAEGAKKIRAGMIGLDTSHCVAFTKVLNDPKATGDIGAVDVVVAFPGGSDDIPDSRNRVEGFTKEMRGLGVEIVDSIDVLLTKCDVVLLESVDGRPHWEQARPVIAAKKPLFIDKPVAGTLVDAIAIYELAEKHDVPVFSSSSLRFGTDLVNLKSDPKLGDVVGCIVHSPCALESHHPDLFWYGVHGVEMVYTIMGNGCETVVRTHTDGTDVVTGTWRGGRVATYRGVRDGKADYGGIVYGTKSMAAIGKYEGYGPLVGEIATFFRTRKPPVSAAETIEMFAFMEAADESKRQGGKPVSIADVMQQAEKKAVLRSEEQGSRIKE
jgi:predicted dehydrogenase